MGDPSPRLFAIQDIPNAGRGVVACAPISKGARVLCTRSPVIHVVFWQYRKEVCAQCFHYDRGRTLPVRENDIGKVFCSTECQNGWLSEQGDVGLDAWKQLSLYVLKKSKAISNVHGLPMLAPKPDGDEIRHAWNEAERKSKSLRPGRPTVSPELAGAPSTSKSFQHAMNRPWSRVVDPDILGFLLSTTLFHQQYPDRWESEIGDLAVDVTPYRSAADIEAHCNSFLQLFSIAPVDILPSVIPSICQTAIDSASHNAFGIRSGSEDGDEYMGYAVYPEASYFNHSCEPNTTKTRVGNEWRFQALREIAVGEQCCITYLGGDENELTATERRARLRAFWGFECGCERCERESGER